MGRYTATTTLELLGFNRRDGSDPLRLQPKVPRRLHAAWSAAMRELRGTPPTLTDVRMTVLPSGLRVVSERMPFMPAGTAVIGVWIDAGGRHDPEGLLGTAHFLEHCNFLGTRRRNADDIADQLDRLGAGKNATTTIDTTNYFVSVSGEGLSAAVDLLGDMLLRSRLAEADVNSERQTILDEADKVTGGRAKSFSIRASQGIFPQSPLPVIGSADEIRAIRAAGLAEFRARHATADRMAVVAAGNIDHKQLCDLVARHFADSPSTPTGAANPRRRSTRGIPLFQAGDFRELDADTNQIALDLIFPGYGLTDPKRRAAIVLEFMLGNGFSSGLYRAMRRKQQITYDYHCGHVSYAEYGYFSLGGYVDPRHANLFVETIANQLCALPSVVRPEAVEQAKHSIRSNLNFGRFSPYSRYMALGSTTLAAGQPAGIEQVEAAIRKITTDEVRAVAAEMFSRSPAVVAYGPVGELMAYDQLLKLVPAGAG